MRTESTDNERKQLGVISNMAMFRTCGWGRMVNLRGLLLAPMLALAFASVISSCDETDTKKHAEDKRLQLIPGSASGTFDKSTETLLLGAENIMDRGAGITAAEVEMRQEASFNRDYLCRAQISQDRNTKQLFVSISVPVSRTTYEERKKEAESPKARGQLIECYKLFRVDLPPRLSAAGTKSSDMTEPVLGIGAAHADNGNTCLKKQDGSCSYSGTEGCCQ